MVLVIVTIERHEQQITSQCGCHNLLRTEFPPTPPTCYWCPHKRCDNCEREVINREGEIHFVGLDSDYAWRDVRREDWGLR